MFFIKQRSREANEAIFFTQFWFQQMQKILIYFIGFNSIILVERIAAEECNDHTQSFTSFQL